MKIKRIVFAILLSICLSARADNYAGLGFGYSWNGGHAYTNSTKYDFKSFSKMWSFFVGKVIPNQWFDLRLDAEYLNLDAHVEHGRTRQFKSVMANATGIIPDTGWLAEPYVGMGLGYARFDHNNTIALQAIGGLEYVFEQWPIATDVEYRHLWLNEHGGKNRENSSRFNSDTLMLKLKYFF